MGSVNSRDGKLYLDFRFKGVRCREQTRLAESAANRIKLERVLKMIEQQISINTFDYAHHFPDSPRVAKEGANKRGNSSRLTQSFHFFLFEPIFSPVNALNQPI